MPPTSSATFMEHRALQAPLCAQPHAASSAASIPRVIPVCAASVSAESMRGEARRGGHHDLLNVVRGQLSSFPSTDTTFGALLACTDSLTHYTTRSLANATQEKLLGGVLMQCTPHTGGSDDTVAGMIGRFPHRQACERPARGAKAQGHNPVHTPGRALRTLGLRVTTDPHVQYIHPAAGAAEEGRAPSCGRLVNHWRQGAVETGLSID
ncbi:hypothetical protein E2C01_015836 [Portunus trituberculatus]|uniref:Uncharacterized protein n=1 Tax=Portunus trituberculatus TaxID=210409 RepID=A0A5B7DMZ0_PORTR|nr:hypothetical protein [Portunus trituberculatus]